MKQGNASLEGIVLDNRYEIIEKIGTGGMADVYKGRDRLLGRAVAIKILHQNFAGDKDFVARFKREAQAAGKLSHPNIVSMYDVGVDVGYHYIIMEYVEGETLKEYIKRHHRVPVEQAVNYAISIGEGLEHAHLMGIVHCDIKPHNILITPSGRVKVTDFGIARAINTGATLLFTNSVMGSAHYISPEQASGKPVNVSTDIYSLGVVLYEMLTGRVPFEGETPVSVALQHVRDAVPLPRKINPHIPSMVESILLKALAKQQNQRYSSISEMIGDLKLSQGYAGSRGVLPKQHDFATQILPPIQDTSISASSLENTSVTTGVDNQTYQSTSYDEPYKNGEKYVSQEESDEESVHPLLAKINAIPTKVIYLGSLVLFVVAFLWAFLSFGNFWSNATVDVPNVVGKQVSVAQHILEDSHLRVTTSEVSNSEVPAGQVISQTPEAGTSVKEQRTVHLVVSKGAGDIIVPDLQGLTIDQARDKLKALGLVLGKATSGNDDSKPEGIIISQSIQAGGKTTKGAIVDITINKLKIKEIKMPNLVGMTVKEAKDALSALGLSISKINGTNTDDAVVSSTNIASGTTIDGKESIEITAEAKKKEEKKEEKSSNVTKGTIDITVPSGKQGQHIKIVQIDDAGSSVVFDGNRNPGDRVVRKVSGTGNVRIQVFLNGALVQEQNL